MKILPLTQYLSDLHGGMSLDEDNDNLIQIG